MEKDAEMILAGVEGNSPSTVASHPSNTITQQPQQPQQPQPSTVTSTPTTTSPSSHPAPILASSDDGKSILSLILDTGPLIKNDPPVSTLLARARELITTPAVLAEIRDEATRTRVENTLLPFVTVRVPRPDSMRFVSDFARKTGDLGVLSKTDVQLIALAYEVDCERNGSSEVAKKGLVPVEQAFGAGTKAGADKEGDVTIERSDDIGAGQDDARERAEEGVIEGEKESGLLRRDVRPTIEDQLALLMTKESATDRDTPAVEQAAESASHLFPPKEANMLTETGDADLEGEGDEDSNDGSDGDSDSDSDSDGWITPANLKKHQARDSPVPASTISSSQPLGAALLTSDFAMQNVALRAHIAVVSPALARVTELRTWVLRCHGCFYICHDGGRHGDLAVQRRFCPRCGQANLLRASCSVGADGAFRVHLKRNFQWNNRGNVYSVPKPTHGSASGKMRSDMAAVGGGKGGWGRNLILSEDQKEYTKLVGQRKREKKKDLMDEDYFPDLLSVQRQYGEKIKIGAGRSINSRKTRK